MLLLRSRRPRRGVVLLLVLWMLVVLSLIAYSLLFQVATETTITSTRKKQLEAEALARAGIAKAIVDLRNDAIFDRREEAQIFDGEGDVWARPEEDKDEVQLRRGDDAGTFSVRVFDEDGLLNLNQMSPVNVPLMQAILERLGYDEKGAETLACMIADWRDGDTVPTLPTAPANSEGIAYAIIMGEEEGGETDIDEVDPIRMRNENFIVVEELLELYGVTADAFFGAGTPEAEFYREKIGEPTGRLYQIDPPRTRGDERPVGLRDYFTVHGGGTLNVNTAPVHVLAALAEAAGESNGDSWAERFVSNRRGGKDNDIDNDNAFKDRTEMMADQQVQTLTQGGALGVDVGVSSQAFRIISEGRVGEVRVRLEAIAIREVPTFTRVEDFEYIDRARERRDQNSGRYERRESSENELQVQYPFVRIVQMYRR